MKKLIAIMLLLVLVAACVRQQKPATPAAGEQPAVTQPTEQPAVTQPSEQPAVTAEEDPFAAISAEADRQIASDNITAEMEEGISP